MNLSTISAVLNLILAMSIEDQFRRDALLVNLIPVETEANSTVSWDVKFSARNSAGAKAEGYEVQSSDFTTDTRKLATLAWAHYEAYAYISGTALRISAANGRDPGGDGKLREEVLDASNELAVKLGQNAYNGSVAASPTEIEGLARAVDATGTYAGLAQGTYSEWASGENTHALASLSLDAIRTKLFRPFKDATGHMPEFVICPGNVFDAVVALFDAKTTIFTTALTMANGQQVDLARLGFRAVVVDGVPFLEDRHCTANTMYALHSRYLSWRQVPAAFTTMDPGQLQGMIREVTGQTVEINEIATAQMAARSKLTVQMNALAKTGDSTKLQIVMDVQLRLKRRNAAAKLTLT